MGGFGPWSLVIGHSPVPSPRIRGGDRRGSLQLGGLAIESDLGPGLIGAVD
jgi:hypothetical protein